MPADFSLEDDDDKLWDRGDVTLTLPGVGSWDVLPRANPIRETEDFNPDNRPVSYIIESIVAQLYEDVRKPARKALVKAIDDGTVLVGKLTKALRWLGEQREEAQERAVAQKAGRPTTGPQLSTP